MTVIRTLVATAALIGLAQAAMGAGSNTAPLTQAASLAAKAPATTPEAKIPASGAATATTTREEMILLTVDKSKLSAELATLPSDGSKTAPMKSFRIAIGKGEGDKEREGDNKTPEGIYFAQSHIDGKALPQKYGAHAIPLDFPNPIDRVHRKTGHGIWLHGVDRDARIEEAKVTEGCVAFYNSDIDRLYPWLRSHQGVVVIAQDATAVNNPDDVKAVRAAAEGWMAAWMARDVEAYISHYAPDFTYERHDRDSYKEYKTRVFASYRDMSLKFDELRVITHPKYAVSFFNQDFRGDNRFVSIGRKILYWERKEGGGWAIKREVFENRRFEHLAFTDGEMALLSEQGSGISAEDKDKKPNL